MNSPVAEGLELDIIYTVVIGLDVEGHLVPTDGIALFPDAVLILNFSHVARIHEMVHPLTVVYWHFVSLFCLLS